MLPNEVVRSTVLFLGGSSLVFAYCRHGSSEAPKQASPTAVNDDSSIDIHSGAAKSYLQDVKTRRSRLFAVIIVLVGLFALKLGYEQTFIPPNYYSRLESHRHSAGFDIRQSFKRVSLRHHPDKSGDPSAGEIFQELKYIYDVLIDEKSRDAYNRFGEAAAGGDPRLDEVALLLNILAEYLAWGLLIFTATLPPSSRGSRTWLYFMLLCLLGVDAAFQLSGTELPSPLPSPIAHITEWEVSLFLHRIFPGVIVVLIWLAEYFYVDDSALVRDVLADTAAMQKGMMGLSHQLLASLTPLSHLSTNSNSNSSGSGSAGPNGDIDTAAIASIVQQLNASLQESNDTISASIEAFRTSSPGLGSKYHWLIFVFFYGVVYLISG